MTKMDRLMRLNGIDDAMKPNPVAELGAKIDALLTYQGLTVREIGNGAYEVIKQQPASGDYLNPILYTAGDAVTTGMWYYTTDKSLPHEAIKTGVPGSFRDRTYFDFVD